MASPDVTAPFARVLHKGIPRPVESVSIRRELATDLPEQVAAGGSIVAGTGSFAPVLSLPSLDRPEPLGQALSNGTFSTGVAGWSVFGAVVTWDSAGQRMRVQATDVPGGGVTSDTDYSPASPDEAWTARAKVSGSGQVEVRLVAALTGGRWKALGSARLTLSGSARTVEVRGETPPGTMTIFMSVTAATLPTDAYVDDCRMSLTPPLTPATGLDYGTDIDDIKHGDPVTISRGTGGPDGVVTRALTGAVDRASGSALDGYGSVSVVDRIDRLNAKITSRARMMTEVAGGSTGVAGTYTYLGIGPMWLLHDVARRCGLSPYHQNGDTVLWASLAGSLHPSVGGLPTQPTVLSAITARAATYGVGVAGLGGTTTTYPIPPLSPTNQPGSMEVALHVEPGGSVTWSLGQIGAAGTVATLDYNNTTGNVTLNLRGSTQVLPLGDGGVVTLWLGWDASAYFAQLRTPAGIAPALLSDSDLDALWDVGQPGWYVRLNPLADAVYYGLVADRMTHLVPMWSEHLHDPGLDVKIMTTDTHRWVAIPRLDREGALGLLRRMAESLGAGLYLSAYGTLVWRSRAWLRQQPVKYALKGSDYLGDLTFASDSASLRRQVSVTYSRPALTLRKTTELVLWRGSGESFSAGDTSDTWVMPPSGEDWYRPDFDSIAWVDSVNDGSFYSSVIGGTVSTAATGALVRTATSSDVFASWESVNDAAAILHVEGRPAIGAGNVLTLRYPDNSYLSINKGANLPKVRGFGRAVWNDLTYTSQTAGPDAAQDLDLNVGWMVQTDAHAQDLANFVASQTCKSWTRVESAVMAVPILGVELGDKVSVDDPYRLGVKVEALVVGISEDLKSSDSAVSFDQTLDLRMVPTGDYGEDIWTLDDPVLSELNSGNILTY